MNPHILLLYLNYFEMGFCHLQPSPSTVHLLGGFLASSLHTSVKLTFKNQSPNHHLSVSKTTQCPTVLGLSTTPFTICPPVWLSRLPTTLPYKWQIRIWPSRTPFYLCWLKSIQEKGMKAWFIEIRSNAVTKQLWQVLGKIWPQMATVWFTWFCAARYLKLFSSNFKCI